MFKMFEALEMLEVFEMFEVFEVFVLRCLFAADGVVLRSLYTTLDFSDMTMMN